MKYPFIPSKNALLTTRSHSLARKGTVPWGNDPNYVSCLAQRLARVHQLIKTQVIFRNVLDYGAVGDGVTVSPVR